MYSLTCKLNSLKNNLSSCRRSVGGRLYKVIKLKDSLGSPVIQHNIPALRFRLKLFFRFLYLSLILTACTIWFTIHKNNLLKQDDPDDLIWLTVGLAAAYLLFAFYAVIRIGNPFLRTLGRISDLMSQSPEFDLDAKEKNSADDNANIEIPQLVDRIKGMQNQASKAKYDQKRKLEDMATVLAEVSSLLSGPNRDDYLAECGGIIKKIASELENISDAI